MSEIGEEGKKYIYSVNEVGILEITLILWESKIPQLGKI